MDILQTALVFISLVAAPRTEEEKCPECQRERELAAALLDVFGKTHPKMVQAAVEEVNRQVEELRRCPMTVQ